MSSDKMVYFVPSSPSAAPFVKGVLALVSVVALSACGQIGPSQLLDDLSLDAYTDETSGDAFVEMKANLGLGNVTLPLYSYVLEKDGIPYGNIQISTQEVAVIVNMTQGLNLEPTAALLPNGQPLPVDNASEVIAFAAGKSSTVYLGNQLDSLLIGVAIKIKSLDKVAGSIGLPLVWCDAFEGNGAASGTGCIYTGATKAQSGIAIFANATKAVKKLAKSNAQVQEQFSAAKEASAATGKKKIKFKQIEPSDHSELDAELVKFNVEGKKLELHKN